MRGQAGIPVWPMVEDEADDGLATAVARFGDDRRLEQIVICPVDKDLAQLVQGFDQLERVPAQPERGHRP